MHVSHMKILTTTAPQQDKGYPDFVLESGLNFSCYFHSAVTAIIVYVTCLSVWIIGPNDYTVPAVTACQ